MNFSNRRHNWSIAGKIIFTGLLACASVLMSLYISRVTFGKLLSTVDQLSEPNRKLQLVNDLFRDVVKLDLLQRAQALKTDSSEFKPFIKESDNLQAMLDSLRGMSLKNNAEVVRIDSMKHLLYRRDLLFLKYIRLRVKQVKNDTLSGQVKDLSVLIEHARLRIDSNVVTTTLATKTTIDTVKLADEKRPLWKRVFNKKKPRIEIQKKVTEALTTRIDTTGVSQKGDSLAKMGVAISKVEDNRKVRREQLIKDHTELNTSGDLLISDLLSILNDIEQDEVRHDATQNAMAYTAVNSSIVSISAVMIIFILGTVMLIILTFTDIRRSNKYRRELVIAKDAAEEAGLVKQRFLANMSHELRTPLQSIIGISEQVKDVQHPRQRDIEKIHHSSLHLLQIVNEVLDYSRIISGKYVLENKPFNMYDLLEDVQHMIQVQLALKKLSLHTNIVLAGDNNYSGDAFRLKQVLLNLLGNAVKFTDAGSVSLSVVEEAQPYGLSLFTFKVKDTGVGISPEMLAVIFNEFEQGDNSYKKPGTGLGLSIVKAMVDIQAGDIQAESTPGAGTTFTLKLSYTKTTASAKKDELPAVVTGYNEHVWVVDDDSFILQLCDNILTKNNISHTCFSSAHEALDTPFPSGLGIVLLDIRMGEMDGITLCGKLRERAVVNPPKFIALTAQAFPDEQEAILKTGFDGIVVKPFLEQDLLNGIYKQTSEPLTNNEQLSLDLSVIRRMTGDDDTLLHNVLTSFVAETERDVSVAKESYAEKDNVELAEALHRLAGRCGQVGALSLAHTLRKMEIALYNNEDMATVTAGIDEIYVDVAAVTYTIKALLNNTNIPT